MDAREQRGMAIAATQVVSRVGKAWMVPSQSGSGQYCVHPDEHKPTCTCPDHTDGGFVCKHIHAVKYTLIRRQKLWNGDGSVTEITERVDVSTTSERKTYKQDWPNYNAAQVNERRHFHELLAELCASVPEPPAKERSKGGRPPLPVKDRLFAAILKVYALMSARRFHGELEEAHERGFIGSLPHFNYALGVLDNEGTTPMLRQMIDTTALPLAGIESNFAIDSTGFSTCTYARWFDQKYGTPKKQMVWWKAHICTGVKTNVVVALNIDSEDSADCPNFPPLINKTAESFRIEEVTADKAYAASYNFDAVEAHGGRFFPAFKVNTRGLAGGSFQKAFHYFQLHHEDYLRHYHQRSNVESTISMVKRKFGGAVKAKNPVAQKNEILAKFVCHNLCVLIQEMYVMGIDPTFGIQKSQTLPNVLKFPSA